MTQTGDHGGATADEVNAALFVYSPRGNLMVDENIDYDGNCCGQLVQQVWNLGRVISSGFFSSKTVSHRRRWSAGLPATANVFMVLCYYMFACPLSCRLTSYQRFRCC